ncbi:MAG: type II toxin-antitoxin system VapC family toxin [Cyanobacteria bacterium P01_D01_bin.36]
MYLLDTNVISELRKNKRADLGVQRFFKEAIEQNAQLYLSVITLGELRRGVERIRYRGDQQQADLLDHWLQTILADYSEHILDFTTTEAQVWGYLRVPQPQNALDKQIAATALARGLTLVTRNIKDFAETGVPLLNPFSKLTITKSTGQKTD